MPQTPWMSVSVTLLAFMGTHIDAVSFAATATGHGEALGGNVVLTNFLVTGKIQQVVMTCKNSQF